MIDDDPGSRTVIEEILDELGWDVEMAENGTEGIEKAVQGGHAAILLDYKMPDVDGLEVLQRLTAAEIATPVVVVTGRGDEHVATRFLSQGAVEYLAKPNLSPNRLERTLERALWVTGNADSGPPEMAREVMTAEPTRRVLYVTPDGRFEDRLLDALDRSSLSARTVRLASLDAVGTAVRPGQADLVVADLREDEAPGPTLEGILNVDGVPVLAVVTEIQEEELSAPARSHAVRMTDDEAAAPRLVQTIRNAFEGRSVRTS